MIDLQHYRTHYNYRPITGRPTYVYFLKERKAKMIKIGRSTKPEKRIVEVQKEIKGYFKLLGYPIPEFETLAILPESIGFSESKLHYTFKNHRIIKEWFAECKEIYDLLNKIAYNVKLGDISRYMLEYTLDKDCIRNTYGF